MCGTEVIWMAFGNEGMTETKRFTTTQEATIAQKISEKILTWPRIDEEVKKFANKMQVELFYVLKEISKKNQLQP